MSIKNETTIQILKILSSQSKTQNGKKNYINKVYPKGIENQYKTKLTLYFKPLVDYVKKFVNENSNKLLKGDSVNFDSIPGESYKNMINDMEIWIETYFPEDPDENSLVFTGMKGTAEKLKDFEDKEFSKQLEKSIGVSIKEQSLWWNDVVSSWTQNNYRLIKSNARMFVNKINVIVENAIVSGTSVRELQKSILGATVGLSESKCRLLARDQIGKLQGQISEAQMEEIGLEMYIWSTSNDERVRDSHQEMEGLLCRWDDATVYSEDGGKTWIDRPSGAIELHPGQDIQCRCVALAYFPEIEKQIL